MKTLAPKEDSGSLNLVSDNASGSPKFVECIFVGDQRSFPVPIEIPWTVGVLKRAIKIERAQRVGKLDPADLLLYLGNITNEKGDALAVKVNTTMKTNPPILEDSMQKLSELDLLEGRIHFIARTPSDPLFHLGDNKTDGSNNANLQPWSIFLPRRPPNPLVLPSEQFKDRIDDFQKELFPCILEFLKRQRKYWSPPESARNELTRQFYADQKIPVYFGKPLLLLHKLGRYLSQEAEGALTPLQNSTIFDTSGAGKTRFVFECLHRVWGFYLVSACGPDKIGWRDLQKAINAMSETEGWVQNVFENSPSEKETEQRSEGNYRIVFRYILKVLVARWIVFDTFIKAARKLHNGALPDELKDEWIIFQALPVDVGAFTNDREPFVWCINSCLIGVDKYILQETLRLFTPQAILQQEPHAKFLYVPDEAQVANKTYLGSFSSNGHTKRPVLRPIIRAMLEISNDLPIQIFVSGTGFSHEHLQSLSTSGVGVGKDSWRSISGMTGFMDQKRQLEYVKSYLPASFLQPESGEVLKARSPHKLFNAYVEAFTTFKPVDGPIDIMRNEADVGPVGIGTFHWEQIETYEGYLEELALIIYAYLTRGEHLPLSEPRRYLVECALARFSSGGHIVVQEPMALVGIFQYFHKKTHKVTKYLRMQAQFSRGKAFEYIVLLAMTSILRDFCPLRNVFDFLDEHCDLANVEGRIVARESTGEFVSMHTPSAEVATRVYNVAAVTKWIRHGTSAWCLPDSYMGPDLLTWIELSDGRHILVAIQAKSYSSGNQTTVPADVTAATIDAVNPKFFYAGLQTRKKNPHKEAKLQGDIHRMLNAIVLPQELTMGDYNLLGVIAA
ncbi:hypothetical protein FRC17_001503, partial [Serendipita sp. 399]